MDATQKTTYLARAVDRERPPLVLYSMGLSAMLCIAGLAGCGQRAPLPTQAGSKVTYSGCLGAAMASASTRPMDEIRQGCAEAASVVEATYKMDDKGNFAATDDFTRCYDVEKKRLTPLLPNDAVRFAKLSCKYPDLK